ncbi:MAG: hypothetical protein NC184_04305 [Roseburia sp.]|nr:hypothetical protein [Roseburia sp.]
MQRAKRKTIENILFIFPLIYGLQDKIDAEQEVVIHDTALPAHKVVETLIALDNRRVDLCNLAVLHAFIKRGLDGEFDMLCRCAAGGLDSPLFDAAERYMRRAGYDVERAQSEFSYLFKQIKRKPRSRRAPDPAPTASVCYYTRQ